MQEPGDDDTTITTPNGGLNHRTRLHPLSTITSPNNVTFRLLCPVPNSGALIGKSGSVVKLLEKETAAKIRVESSIPRCEERIVNIISAEEPKKTITLKRSNNAGKEDNSKEEEEEVEVSPAQYGLIRVLERVLEVGEELEEIFPSPGSGKGLVTCRLLADRSQIGYMMGYGGRKLRKIEEDSGAMINISADRCPACASPTDELIQITGESLALKRAVLAVSQCLQDSPPMEKVKVAGSKSYRTAPNVSSVEFLPRQASFPPPRVNSSVDYASRGYSLLAEEEVVFRLICPGDRIGGLIGKGGVIVKSLQDRTGASICVAAPVAESDDRVIHVSALESVESRHSPAQNAVICVFARSIEVGNGKLPESSGKKIVEARVLVSLDQIGSLIGKGGAIISEMRKATRTNMWVLPRDQLPSCVSENDAVVRISGGIQNVQEALLIVTSKLRDHCFPSRRINSAGRFTDLNFLGPCASADLSHKLGPYNALTDNMHHLGLVNHLDHPPSPMQLRSRMMTGDSFGGVMSYGRGTTAPRNDLEHVSSVCGGTKSAIVRNATLEILVPVHVLGSVYEEKESNLDRIRQISGASVMVSEPFRGTSELTVIISGTPDQTQAAQMVLQAFMQKTVT